MKQIFKITSFLLTLMLVASCEKEYVAPDDELVDATWYTSGSSDGVSNVEVGDYISFMDASQGFISHQWELAEGAGTYFLGGDFYQKDTLADYIDASMSNITNEATVHVLFSKTGLQTVRLYNTFAQKVTYPGTVPFDAVQVGEEWIIDTSFVVDVYGPMLPAFSIYQVLDDGSDSLILAIDGTQETAIEDTATWKQIELEAGTTLKYVDMTTEDRPTGRTWTVNSGSGNKSYTDSVSAINFLKLGKRYLGGNILSEREANGEMKKSTTKKLVPLKIDVVPSSKPFTFLGDMQEAQDQTITFRVSGEMAALSDAKAALTVHVENTAAAFSQDIAVATVAINDKDASLLDITLTEAIYNSDIITVSFDNTLGTITSTDSRELNSFSGELVAMHEEQSITNNDYVGFEVADANIKKAYVADWWFGNNNDDGNGMPMFERVTTMSYDGEASLKYQYTDGVAAGDKKIQGAKFPEGAGTKKLPAGKYKVSLPVYLDNDNTMSEIKTTQALPFTAMTWSLTGVPRGEWVVLTQTLDFVSEVSGKYIIQIPTASNASATGKQLMYIDAISYVLVETRP